MLRNRNPNANYESSSEHQCAISIIVSYNRGPTSSTR